jgi:hypothetical protein
MTQKCICQQCEKEFTTVQHNHKKPKKFCSSVCRSISKRKYALEVNCKQCNKIILNPGCKKFCNRSCSASYNSSRRDPRTDESKKKTSDSLFEFLKTEEGKKVKVARGLKNKKDEKDKVKYFCIECNKQIRNNKTKLCKVCYLESDLAKENQAQYSIKYKKGYVYNKWFDKQVYLMSGLEYSYFEYLEKYNIRWNTAEKIKYSKDGKDHTYTPDFYLPDENKFIEIKGYMWEDAKIKMNLVFEQHPELNLVILNKKDVKRLLAS